jgi:hypothetical protein
MRRLANVTDWSLETGSPGIALGGGSFDVAVSGRLAPQSDSNSATRLDFSVTGGVPGTGSVVIRRTMMQSALKLPSAVKFALFWGRRTGSTLNLGNNVSVAGDIWSQGSITVPASSSIADGTLYHPATESASGSGSFAQMGISYPYFSLFPGASITDSHPRLDASYYVGHTNLVLNGNTLRCRNFNTNTTGNTNVVISGRGFIVASQNINLNASGANNRSLNISPSGGNIVFIAAGNITVNSGSGGNHPVGVTSSGSSRVRMYGRNSGTGERVIINNANTVIDGALILAGRRIVVQNGADITGSTLFVNDNPGGTNNNLTVTGSGTVVGIPGAPSTLISVGRGTPAMQILTTARITGLVYQGDISNLGTTNINGQSSSGRVNISGSIIANQFASNRVNNANIYYDPQALPDPPPEGFNGFAAKKPDSWGGF